MYLNAFLSLSNFFINLSPYSLTDLKVILLIRSKITLKFGSIFYLEKYFISILH